MSAILTVNYCPIKNLVPTPSQKLIEVYLRVLRRRESRQVWSTVKLAQDTCKAQKPNLHLRI